MHFFSDKQVILFVFVINVSCVIYGIHILLIVVAVKNEVTRDVTKFTGTHFTLVTTTINYSKESTCLDINNTYTTTTK